MRNLEKYQAMLDHEPQIEIAVRGGKTCGQIARIMGFATDTVVRRFMTEHRPDLLEIVARNGTRAQKNPHRNPDISQISDEEKARAQLYANQLQHVLGAKRAYMSCKVTESTWSRWRRGESSPSRAGYTKLQSVHTIYCSEVDHGPAGRNATTPTKRILPSGR